MEANTAVKGLLDLPAEIRNAVYQFLFGTYPTIEITLASARIASDMSVTASPNACKSVESPSLALLRTNKAIYSEAFTFLQSARWLLVVSNCSFQNTPFTAAVLDRVLPEWLYGAVRSLQINLYAWELRTDVLEFAQGTGSNRFPSFPGNMYLMDCIPLTKLTALKSCYINIDPEIITLSSEPSDRLQEEKAVFQMRQTLGVTLRLTPQKIIECGSERMRGVETTASVRFTALGRSGDGEQQMETEWKVVCRCNMDGERQRMWLPVRKLVKQLGVSKEWVIDPSFWPEDYY